MYESPPPDYPDYGGDGGGGGGLSPAVFHLVLLCTVTVCVVSLVFFVTCLYLKYKRRELDRQRYLYRAAQQSDQGPGGSLKELLEQSSGTGGGLPLLVQRTIAKQVRELHLPFDFVKNGKCYCTEGLKVHIFIIV